MNTLENSDTATSTTNPNHPANGTNALPLILPNPGEQEQEEIQQQAPEAEATTAAQQPPLLAVPATLDPAKQKQRLVLNSAVAKADALSDTEFGILCACEEVISKGWQTFVEVGEALACIRDQELYRDNFHSFEAYCQVKWQYKRAYVYRLISAAQLFNHLSTNCRQRRPDHESQLQPLMGLTLDDAGRAWEKAVELAGGRKITAQLVKRAMRHLQLKKITDPAPRPIRVNKAKQRELIDHTFGELLVLLSQKAGYELITQKVEALHTHVHALLAQLSPARA